jgi:hypothetical protein
MRKRPAIENSLRNLPAAERRALEAVFWSRVDKDGPTCPHLGTNCWLWTGGKSSGRGMLYVPSVGRNCQATRVGWALFVGPITDGKPFLLHHCDVGACVRLDHLHDGTHADNMREAVERKRMATVANGGHLAATTEGLAIIRARNADPVRNAKIGEASKRIARATWDDPEIRARRVAGIRRAAERRRGASTITEEGRRALAECTKARWAEPEYRARMSGPEARARAAAASAAAVAVNRALWADPERRVRRGAAISAGKRAAAERRRALVGDGG